MNRFPMLLPVLLIAAGIKCILLYSGVLFLAFGAVGAVFGISWVTGSVLALVVLAIGGGGFYWWRQSKSGAPCPIPTSWFRRERQQNVARLIRAEPTPNSVLDRSPGRLTVWFGAPIEPSLSELKLVDANGNHVETGSAIADSAEPAKLSVTLPDLAPGAYTVVWRNLASASGQSVGGSFAFSIGEAVRTRTALPAS